MTVTLFVVAFVAIAAGAFMTVLCEGGERGYFCPITGAVGGMLIVVGVILMVVGVL